ncbi:MAG: hypothetical protein K2Y22_11155 [Candidatus Obscuribacterales bacterium]|nr:hypothetical protein [Candidatus Obscuribacterales bacterium]
MLRTQLKELICSALWQSGSVAADGEIEILSATKDGRGDYACAIAARLSGKSKNSAEPLAQAIAKFIDSDLLEKVEVAGNGFINLTVSNRALALVVHNILKNELPRGLGTQAVRTDWRYTGQRLSAALQQVREPRLNLIESCLELPVLSDSQWQEIEVLCLRDIHILQPAFNEANKKLVLLLDEFWLQSAKYHHSKNESFYAYIDGLALEINQSHILDGLPLSDPELIRARIGLICAAKRVFDSCLGILN